MRSGVSEGEDDDVDEGTGSFDSPGLFLNVVNVAMILLHLNEIEGECIQD